MSRSSTVPGLLAPWILVLFVAFAPGAAAPRRIVVSDVSIMGNRQVNTEYIRNLLKTRANQPFDADLLREDMRLLYSTRQFRDIYANKVEDGPGRVKVIFHVRDDPSKIEKVTYQGNVHLSTDELNELSGVRKGMPCNPMANKSACRRIVQRYNEEGRPFASCDLIKGSEMGDTEVIFHITEGPRVRISSIGFQGNTIVSSPVLKKHLESSAKKHGLFDGTYNAARLDHDQSELLRYYRSFGFHNVRIARELLYSSDGRDVTVVFHINEGVQSEPQKSMDNPYQDILQQIQSVEQK